MALSLKVSMWSWHLSDHKSLRPLHLHHPTTHRSLEIFPMDTRTWLSVSHRIEFWTKTRKKRKKFHQKFWNSCVAGLRHGKLRQIFHATINETVWTKGVHCPITQIGWKWCRNFIVSVTPARPTIKRAAKNETKMNQNVDLSKSFTNKSLSSDRVIELIDGCLKHLASCS